MIQIRIADADRTRLGTPAVLEYDTLRPRLAEVRELRRQCGWTFTDLGTRIRARDYEAVGVVVWLACRRAGVVVPWDEFDLDMAEVVFSSPADGAAEADGQADGQGNPPAPDGA